MNEPTTAQKQAMDQVYAGHFYELLAQLAHHFIARNPMASHAVMGACLKYSARIAQQIGMRPIDFRGLATAVFSDPPEGPRR